MNLHFSFKAESAKTPDIERDLQLHVQKLQRHLTAFRPELIHLHGTIDKNPREGFTVSLNLRLPTGQLTAQEAGHVLSSSMKVAFAELLGQLKRHKELIRNEHRWRRGRKPPRGASTQLQESLDRHVSRGGTHEREPHPRPDRGKGLEKQQSDGIDAETFDAGSLPRSDVRAYINGNLKMLQRFVEREIRFREEDGSLQRESLSPEEVLDEIVVNALSSEGAPDGLSAERWVYKIALDAITELALSNGDGSDLRLEEPLGQPNVSATDDEMLQYHQPGERHNREDFLRNDQVATPEQAAANDEMIDQLDDALKGLPSDQRQAFLLYTVEGFTLEEVSEVLSHERDDIKRLISSVRDHVMKKLPPSNALKQRLIEHSDVA